jgi:hypothetical protein
MDNGFILLSRNILDSDVFASQKLLKIWLWCLCKANFKDKSVPLKIGKGETIVRVKRGSFIFGRNKAEDELFIDGSTIYKSMQKLKDLSMIEIKSNNQYSIVTISNYDAYQDSKSYKVTSKEQPSNNQVTTKEQPSNTTKNYNNVNKDKNVNNLEDSDFNEIEILPLNNQEEKRKKVAPKKENETIIATDEFLELWNEYKSYRVAKKKTFKFANLRFEQMAFDKLFKLSNQNFETAKKIVTQTIENNWEGLFELKENKIIEPIVAGRQTMSTIKQNMDWSGIVVPNIKPQNK